MSLRNIKVKFLSKAPSGFETGDIEFCSEFELKQLEASGEYKIEVLSKAKKSKKSKKPKKSKKSYKW